jgi:hypothetical protein
MRRDDDRRNTLALLRATALFGSELLRRGEEGNAGVTTGWMVAVSRCRDSPGLLAFDRR